MASVILLLAFIVEWAARTLRHVVIGTAGHVDHGKTELTRALTGVNTDRWAAEQERGITLDLGFAPLVLPSGRTASVVDVPGHERLIDNMLAGATGFDTVLFVVAADEGFMPQSQEHLDILTLLDVKSGIIVITKKDLVDGEWLSLVEEDVRKRVKGTFLEDAPLVSVSSLTGEGIPELLALIDHMVEMSSPALVDRPFRLPVDRAFSVRGAGTVVTGTMTEGKLRQGEGLVAFPSERPLRARELQFFGKDVGSAQAGMRVAINVPNATTEDVARGTTLAAPDSVMVSRRATVTLHLMGDAPFSVKNASQLHFYLGTQQLICRVRLFSCDELTAGETDFAQLSFADDLVARPGDRFVVRFFSPLATVGGGVVLELGGRRMKRHDETTVLRLRHLSGEASERVRQAVVDSRCSLVDAEAVALLCGLSCEEARAELDAMVEQKEALRADRGYVSSSALEGLAKKLGECLADYHRAHPLRDGMGLGELRERISSLHVGASDEKTEDSLIGLLEREGMLEVREGMASLPGHEASYPPEDAALRISILRALDAAGFQPPSKDSLFDSVTTDRKSFDRVVARMSRDGEIIPLSQTTLCTGKCYDRAKSVFVAMFDERESVTLAQYKERLGVSRKFAQLFLESFDRAGISRLADGSRFLRNRDKDKSEGERSG